MTSFRKIVDGAFQRVPLYMERYDVIIWVIEELARELDRRFPEPARGDGNLNEEHRPVSSTAPYIPASSYIPGSKYKVD